MKDDDLPLTEEQREILKLSDKDAEYIAGIAAIMGKYQNNNLTDYDLLSIAGDIKELNSPRLSGCEATDLIRVETLKSTLEVGKELYEGITLGDGYLARIDEITDLINRVESNKDAVCFYRRIPMEEKEQVTYDIGKIAELQLSRVYGLKRAEHMVDEVKTAINVAELATTIIEAGKGVCETIQLGVDGSTWVVDNESANKYCLETPTEELAVEDFRAMSVFAIAKAKVKVLD